MNESHWKTDCPKVDCRNKNKCRCGLKYVNIPASLGDDGETSPVAPEKGAYCNAIVVYEANKHVYIYSTEGIPTLIDVDATDISELEALTEDALERIAEIEDSVSNVFDTVADMVASSSLMNGSYARTLGRLSINDGGGAIYKVVDAQNNAEWQVNLGDGLYATLIGPLSPENTGLPVDVLLNSWNDKELTFGESKTYTITSPIIIRDIKYYDFKNSTITYDGDSTVEDMINIGYDHHASGVVMRVYAGIKNVILDGNSLARNVLHISGGKSLVFENIQVKNPLNYGILADRSVGQTWELYFDNIEVNAKNSTINKQGLSAIKIDGITDSSFTNVYPVNGSVAWMEANTAMSHFTNIHGYKFPDTSDYVQVQGYKFEGHRNSYSNIIVDTADAIGITAAGTYNNYKSICLYMKAGGKGIVDSDNNNYDGITVHRPLATVIEKALGGTYLHVSGIACEKQSGTTPTTDISFLDSKLPKMFSYDWSARCVNPLKNNFLFTGTCTSGSPSASISFPVALDNNGYMINVMLNKAMPYSITNRLSSGFTLSFNADDITALGSVGYVVRVTPVNGTN